MFFGAVSQFVRRSAVHRGGRPLGTVARGLFNRHNIANATVAADTTACAHGIQVHDDFAHHPTAIAATLRGLRAHVSPARVVVVLEPRSNSMRAGVHRDALAGALAEADLAVILLRPDLPWDATALLAALGARAVAAPDVDTLLEVLEAQTRPGDHVLFMSNGDFGAAPLRFARGTPART